jgi:CRISPR system Cascade subunit CasA
MFFNNEIKMVNIMNLITDSWLPVQLDNGTTSFIAPYEIANSEVVDININRADFKGALYQFLIALLQLSIAPEDDDELFELLETPLAVEKMQQEFLKFKDHFNLLADISKPAFMQDLTLNEGEPNSIASLLIEYPGDNAIKNNTDHFIKRNDEIGFCYNCTASALFCLQINAPSGGSGHRTGLRGGGPLTTLLMPKNIGLWQKLVINLSTQEDFAIDNKNMAEILPWLSSIENFNKSKSGTYATDNGVNKLQAFWSMPRRIRLQPPKKSGYCSICGAQDVDLITHYTTKNYGINYVGEWQHPLSPHYKKTEKSKIEISIPIKGKTGGIGIKDWLSLNFDLNGTDEKATAAKVVANYHNLANEFSEEIDENIGQPSLWCFGYDMDNMKVRGYYDQQTPVVHIQDEVQRKLFISKVKSLLETINKVADALKIQLKQALFNRPQDKKGDFSKIDTAFYAKLETSFYNVIKQPTELISTYKHFALQIKDTALYLFDTYAMNSELIETDLQRVVTARLKLKNIINKQLKLLIKE